MKTTQPSQPATSASAAPGRTTMQAIVQHRYGTRPEDVLRLEQVATPAIAANEVLVQVRAAAVDRGTWHLMAGQPYLMRLLGFGLRGPKSPVPGLAAQNFQFGLPQTDGQGTKIGAPIGGSACRYQATFMLGRGRA
jgi:hypothetical protein